MFFFLLCPFFDCNLYFSLHTCAIPMLFFFRTETQPEYLRLFASCKVSRMVGRPPQDTLLSVRIRLDARSTRFREVADRLGLFAGFSRNGICFYLWRPGKNCKQFLRRGSYLGAQVAPVSGNLKKASGDPPKRFRHRSVSIRCV